MDETGRKFDSEVEEIRKTITEYLQDRLQPKLDPIENRIKKLKEEDTEKRDQLEKDRQKEIDKYKPENWISDAVLDAEKIQQATHAIKYMHPDAKGTCLNVPGNPNAGDLCVGTHTLGDHRDHDVVYRDAKYLPLVEFVLLDVNGKTLLTRAVEGDQALEKAFSIYTSSADSWMDAFADVAISKDTASHERAKQIYWPLDDGTYHLLAPLHPTTLVHEIWNDINRDRFSDSAKAAQQARRNNAPYHEGCRDHLDLVEMKFGGDNPQNISQLNRKSERRGRNYLLPSYPPTWKSERVRPPMKEKSVFDHIFGRRKRVKDLTDVLLDFLSKVKEVNNVRIRNKRAELVSYIRDELLQFASEIQELDGGWSKDEDCLLNTEEKCWLDPRRAETDEEFAAVRNRGTWQDAVCGRFGNWLNARLTSDRHGLYMGEAEALEWQSVLDDELRMIRMEVDFDG